MCSNINWENKMTKRFTTKNGVFYTDNLTGWEFQSYGEVVKLMNELSEENEQLKQQNEELINGMQETARLSAKAITKPLVEVRGGKGAYK